MTTRTTFPQPTRLQREALYRLFERAYPEFGKLHTSKHFFPSRGWRTLYREWRKRFYFQGFGSDKYLFGQPFLGSELYVGIEKDGYTHS